MDSYLLLTCFMQWPKLLCYVNWQENKQKSASTNKRSNVKNTNKQSNNKGHYSPGVGEAVGAAKPTGAGVGTANRS